MASLFVADDDDEHRHDQEGEEVEIPAQNNDHRPKFDQEGIPTQNQIGDGDGDGNGDVLKQQSNGIDLPIHVQPDANLQHANDGADSSIPVRFELPETTVLYPEREVKCTLPLKYQQSIVEDMLKNDGLLILGRGLGWDLISSNLLHALSSPIVMLQQGNSTKQEKRGLIFILNAREDEITRLKEELTDLHWLQGGEDDCSFTVITGTSHNTSAKRKLTYNRGGIISINSQILVVDILSGIIPANDITGLFVLHAEKMKETSNDSFVISLYRDNNDWGFIKAVSDEPELFTGFTPLASKLKMLRVTNVFLWPRFHVEISSSLNMRGKSLSNRQKHELESRKFVTEINVKLSYKMSKIQQAILSCIQACLQELKRHNADLATEYWEMDNIHDSDFVSRIRLSVDSQWHRLTYTSKQLVYDLGTLTNLLKSLVTLDSVSFYQIVQGIVDLNIKHVSSGPANVVSMSPWLNLDDSNTIISYARDRALAKITVTKGEVLNNDGGASEVDEEYLLEELPKWNQLGILLDDIMHEKSVKPNKDEGPILIMCSSPKIVEQISSLLVNMQEVVNPNTHKKAFKFRNYMVKKLNDYLSWREVNLLVTKLTSELNTDSVKNPSASATSILDVTSNEESPGDEEIITSRTFSRQGEPVSKRRRTRGASTIANISKLYGSAVKQASKAVDLDPEILERLQHNNKDIEPLQTKSPNNDIDVVIIEDDESSNSEFVSKKLEHISKDNQIIVQAYNERCNDALLQELAPSYIIMYEPNLAFIRRVEIYQAINKDNPAKTFFMYYGTSFEEQKHLSSIKKEKEAFTKLIKEKANLSRHFELAEDNRKFKIQKNQLLNTRIAGGSRFRRDTDELRVIVDVREFRSDLPNLLYRVGIIVVPCMITVGDYIVSPKICIERKSIPDLISSFKSGRLYEQCEQMFRHYELPTLLIEFDGNKSFSLQPFSEKVNFRNTNTLNPTTSNVLQQNIQSKIMALLISFPKLKIIWSSSPYETAQIFLELKANQEEPDVGTAMDKGVNKGVLTEDGGPPSFNDDPIDFIQNIPGINKANYYNLIQKVENIQELVTLSKEQFEDILGQENGRKAFYFINHQIK